MGCNSRSNRRAVALEVLDEVCLVAVAEASRAAEEASRRKNQADKQQSSELAMARPGPMGFVTSGLPCVHNCPLSPLPPIEPGPNHVLWKPLLQFNVLKSRIICSL